MFFFFKFGYQGVRGSYRTMGLLKWIFFLSKGLKVTQHFRWVGDFEQILSLGKFLFRELAKSIPTSFYGSINSHEISIYRG